MKSVSPEQAIEVLNRAYNADPIAIHNLVNNRVFCLKELAEDQTIQVGRIGKAPWSFEVGMLGIINGIFGADENSIGYIAAIVENGMLQGFALRSDCTGSPDEKPETGGK